MPRPGLLLITFDAVAVNPEVADALDVPVAAIAGKQPSEFSFGVQYVVGAPLHSRTRTWNASIPDSTMLCVLASFAVKRTRMFAVLARPTVVKCDCGIEFVVQFKPLFAVWR